MCPLWPVHYVFMYLVVLGPLWLLSFRMVGAAAEASKNSKWDVVYEPASPDPILVDDWKTINVNLSEWSIAEGDRVWVEYIVDDPNIAEVSYDKVELSAESEKSGSFNVTGKFLGYTKVCPEITSYSLVDPASSSSSSAERRNSTFKSNCLDVSVVRKSRPIDLAFTYSVIALVAIIYINMGAALDVQTVRTTLKRPVGPLIGFMSQFVIMPVLAFGIAKMLITLPALQLGLFITGCSPGGGASNIWTLTLGGNLDLSITMTTISTFSAFAMMPLWILTLGSTIFEEAKLTIPYAKIANFAVSLVVPLIIGVTIQRCLPKFAKLLVRILKPFAIFLIVFIVVFAIYTNLYLFEIFTWQILIAGLLLPWLGYILGGGTAYLLKQDWRDVVAIGIETGVQNTGLAIFALRFSMPQPEADLTTALPVAVAMMTPIFPTLLLIIQKIRGRKFVEQEEERKDPLFQHNGGEDMSHQGGRYIPGY